MDVFMSDAFSLLTWGSILFIIFGAVLGLIIGALPGLGPTVGIAVLLPITFAMEPIDAVLMLAALYAAGEYGGSITAILLGIPGSASAVPVMLDGNTIARQGHPGRALGYSLTSATLGGLFGGLVLVFLTGPLGRVALNFSDPEMFLLASLGLVCVVGLGSASVSKTVISVLVGLLLSSIGMDVFTGSPRFTMGSWTLMEGLAIVTVVTGLFAFTELFTLSQDDLDKRYVTDAKKLKVTITWPQFKGVSKNILRGSLIGTVIGILPGLGPTIGSWIAYTEAKRTSKNPENFGKGEPNGIAAAEAAGNAVVSGALLPMLTLGIPGSATVALILVALLIHGIQPGPRVFVEQPGLVYGIIWGFLLANVIMFILGRYTTALWARLLTIPGYILLPIVFLASMIGAYGAGSWSIEDVAIALFIGTVGFLINKLDYSFPAFILAFVLGGLIESSLRRTLMVSHGSLDIFITRPYSLAIVILMGGIVLLSIYSRWKKWKHDRSMQIPEAAGD